MRVTKQILADALHATGWQAKPPRNYIEALRARLSQHDGCSRFSPKDSLLLRAYEEIPEAIANAKKALARDDSHDDIRNSLVAVLEVLGEEMPECSCQRDCDRSSAHSAECPLNAWEEVQ